MCGATNLQVLDPPDTVRWRASYRDDLRVRKHGMLRQKWLGKLALWPAWGIDTVTLEYNNMSMVEWGISHHT